MRLWILSALTALVCATGPASAFDISQMSPEEREAFGAEIRTYLLENPQVIMEAVQALEARQQQAQAAVDRDIVAANAAAIFDADASWVGGNPEGDVTIVEFMDYRCGFCRRAAPVLDTLLQRDGNIRLVMKEFPILGEQSVIMSRFAIATLQIAGDDAYKTVHDVMLAADGEMSETRLRRIAADLGLNADAILAHMTSPDVTQVIVQNRALAQRLNIQGTPSFIVGEQILRGFLPADQMELVVDQARG